MISLTRVLRPVVAVAVLASACATAVPTSTTDQARPDATATAADPTRTPRPSRTPRPTSPFVGVRPTTDTPAGWQRTESAPIAINLAFGGVLVYANMDTGIVHRYDRRTLASLGDVAVARPRLFPPAPQSIAQGSDGAWLALGYQRAVGLMNPSTGEITRMVEIDDYPYDMAQRGRDLWIADFGGRIYRYDLRASQVVATIPVRNPTDVIVADGAVWASVHLGRAEEFESIEGNGAHVARIDPGTNTVTALVEVGPRPYYLAAGFGSVWTGTATGEAVWRIDTATNAPTRIPVLEDGVFDIEAVGDSVWAVPGPQWDRECDPATSWFVRIDPATNTVSERVAFPCPIGITPDGDGFWVSGGGPDGTISAYFEPIAGG